MARTPPRPGREATGGVFAWEKGLSAGPLDGLPDHENAPPVPPEPGGSGLRATQHGQFRPLHTQFRWPRIPPANRPAKAAQEFSSSAEDRGQDELSVELSP